VLKENMVMGTKSRKAAPGTTWVTVPVANKLHGQVRARAVVEKKGWPQVMAEAMALWLAAQGRKAA
jgi:hypothetical protein